MTYPIFILDDTIAAIASSPGGAARGIIRLSGPCAWACLSRSFRAEPEADGSKVAAPSVLSGRLHIDGWNTNLPGQALLWPNGCSYTGQAVAELHTLGSPPLLAAVLREVCQAGARLAEPGEFTLRAFLSGHMDLTQAEAVLGVIDAASPNELDVALVQLAGGLARPLHALREQLMELLAHVEAGLDFPEEDISFITPDELDCQLAEATDVVERMAAQLTARNTSSALLRAVIVGRPNAGKSSLFNALTDGAALVSSQPGTTRDYLVAELDLGSGLKCQLVDTAGVDSASEEINQSMQSMAAQQARDAWLQLVCIDGSEESILPASSQQILVRTKCDLGYSPQITDGIATSAATGQGLDELRDALRQAAATAAYAHCGAVVGTAARCGESLRLAAQCLAQARQANGEELAALEIRAALNELGTVVGAVYTEDILHRVFSRFCVGK